MDKILHKDVLTRYNISNRRTYIERFRRKSYLAKKRKCNFYTKKYKASSIIDRFFEINKNIKARSQHQAIAQMNVPKVFSIIENPNETLFNLYCFLVCSRYEKTKGVFFNHYNLTRYDIAAEAILDFFAKEIDNEFKLKGKRITHRGCYPLNDECRRFIKAFGIVRALDIQHEQLDKEENKKIVLFKKTFRMNDEFAVGASDYKDTTTKGFIEHINMCLSSVKLKLSRRGIFLLGQYISEILENIEEHSGERMWEIYGYLDQEQVDKQCEIVIFNIGQSIAKSFKTLSKDSFPYKTYVKPYIEPKKNYNFHEDTLLTLLALQGGVSSLNTDSNTTRGQGTIQLINFFSLMHDTACTAKNNINDFCKMAIISGDSYILFDGKYKPQKDRNGRYIVAFNKNNSLADFPDKNYVKHLQYSFPGTIISIKFSLQHNITEEV